MTFKNYSQGFLRLPSVLKIIPVSKSSWYAGIKSGKYPAPVKIGERTTVWREADIMNLVEQFSDTEN